MSCLEGIQRAHNPCSVLAYTLDDIKISDMVSRFFVSTVNGYKPLP